MLSEKDRVLYLLKNHCS